jgi:hypothetical protein
MKQLVLEINLTSPKIQPSAFKEEKSSEELACLFRQALILLRC